MNIKNLQELLPTSFEYTYTAVDGTEKTETIELGLNRVSFEMSHDELWQKAFSEVANNPKRMAQLLAGRTKEECGEGEEELPGVIGRWSLFMDDANTTPYPIGWKSIVILPGDLVFAMAEATILRLAPNPPKAETSDDGSAQTNRSDAPTT